MAAKMRIFMVQTSSSTGSWAGQYTTLVLRGVGLVAIFVTSKELVLRGVGLVAIFVTSKELVLRGWGW